MVIFLLIFIVLLIIIFYSMNTKVENMINLSSTNNNILSITKNIDLLIKKIQNVIDTLFSENGFVAIVNSIIDWQKTLIGKSIPFTIQSQCIDINIPSIPEYSGYNNNNIYIPGFSGFSGITTQLCTNLTTDTLTI